MRKPALICPRCGAPKDGPCLPCKRASARAYIARNKEKVRAKNDIWKANNREHYDAKAVDYQVANKDEIRVKAATYHVENKEKINQRSAEWRINNPEKCRIQMQNRRAKIRQQGGRLSPGLFDRLFALQQGRCACCGLKIDSSAHLDHIIPIALGGANEDSNMQLLTQKCNNQKHAKDPVAFMQGKGYLI